MKLTSFIELTGTAATSETISLWHLQWIQYYNTAWICKGSSIAPLADYARYKTYQKAVRQEKYFTDSDEKVYIDLRRKKSYWWIRKSQLWQQWSYNNCWIKAPTTTKMRFHVTGYYQGEYMYRLGKDGLIMNYKKYTVQKTKKIGLKNDKKIVRKQTW